MTDAKWLVYTDSRPMLELLRGQSTQRKLRLFLCACSRQLWDGNTPRVVKRVVEVAEQYADAIIGKETLRTVQQETEALHIMQVQNPLSSLAGWTLCPNAREAAEAMESLSQEEDRRLHADLLREVIGNPFRTTKVDRSWLAWNCGTVVKLAETIYEDRAFDHLPGLADALEEAGCSDLDILSHCRQGGQHFRGCWPLDLLLGRR
jgi:hypothetical protein